jgi:hypothetical protein
VTTNARDLGPQLAGMTRRPKRRVLAPEAVEGAAACQQVRPDFAVGGQRDGLATQAHRGPLWSAIAEAMVIGQGFEGGEAFEREQGGPDSEGDGWSKVGGHRGINIDARPAALDYGDARPISTAWQTYRFRLLHGPAVSQSMADPMTQPAIRASQYRMASGHATMSRINVMMQPCPPPFLTTMTCGRSRPIQPPHIGHSTLGCHPTPASATAGGVDFDEPPVMLGGMTHEEGR